MMMHQLMAGMFWGGLVMAIPPIALSIGVVVYLRRQQAREAEATRDAAGE
ncbi:MAG: hypothetical protein ACREL7_12030 [Longimicrobiales bacterium]